jgi:hypothetical protein
MSVEEQIEYHSSRALAEMDRGFTAATTTAARAHLKLSSLHFDRAHRLQGTSQAGRRPVFTL